MVSVQNRSERNRVDCENVIQECGNLALWLVYFDIRNKYNMLRSVIYAEEMGKLGKKKS